MKKILFTTVFEKKPYDYWERNTRTDILRFSWIRRHALGLRFIKRNIPQIEILEYPTWDQYVQKLSSSDYDVVGFSFYINDTPKIIKMIEYARKVGIKEIWGGNYGVLTPGLEHYFDKVFIGYAEKQIGEELGIEVTRIKHPTSLVYFCSPIGLQIITLGILLTTRGCPLACDFCQTPAFCPNVKPIPIESIEEVLIEYRKLGVRELQVLDENFGILSKHAEDVASLLDKYGFYWYPMVRADILINKIDDWYKKGLFGGYIGLESVRQNNLNDISKGESVKTINNLIKKANEKRLFITGYYIIGFEDETENSILVDMKKLKAMDLDLYQLCILTPLPSTPLDDYIKSTYGLYTTDFTLYDTKHLVWNHPNFKPWQMRSLLNHCFKILYRRSSFINTITTGLRRYADHVGWFRTVTYFIKSIFWANISRYLLKDYKTIKIE